MSERHTVQYVRLDAGGLKIKTGQRVVNMRLRQLEKSLGDGCVGVITEWPAPEYPPKHERASLDNGRVLKTDDVIWDYDPDGFIRVMGPQTFQYVLPRPTYYPWRATLR